MGFALGALVLSTALATGTYAAARHLLVEQRERTALRQAYADAALVRDKLLTSGAQVSEVLGSISPPAGAVMYVHRSGRWYSSSLDRPGDELTVAVRPQVRGGEVTLAWSELTEPHAIVIGIPLPAVQSEYYEVSVAEELRDTLQALAAALAVCATLTTLAGALLGRAASRRVLAPLGEVTNAAVKVSVGDMATRLGETRDPDLYALVGAFNHMVDALHERMKQDERFAADVGHELRTPVTTLTTSLSLLQHTEGLSHQASVAVQLMGDELIRFRRVLEDLLALGQLDARARESAVTTTGARALVTHALSSSGRSPDLLQETSGLPEQQVRVDRRQMVRALTNLFENADLHGGGLTGVRIVGGPDHVDIHVEDQGPGVRPQDAERVFDRFARAGGAKAGTGSGLGLSIVAQTARNHGGAVWCAQRRDRGADFTVRLPEASGSPEAAKSQGWDG